MKLSPPLLPARLHPCDAKDLISPLIQSFSPHLHSVPVLVPPPPLLHFRSTVYAMTKDAINQLAKNLACEWAADGIRVNSVAPWYTATSLTKPV